MTTRLPILFTIANCALIAQTSEVHAACQDGVLDSGELCDLMPGTGGGVQLDNNLDCTDFTSDFGTLGCTFDCL